MRRLCGFLGGERGGCPAAGTGVPLRSVLHEGQGLGRPLLGLHSAMVLCLHLRRPVHPFASTSSSCLFLSCLLPALSFVNTAMSLVRIALPSVNDMTCLS